jgi:hypothetical protein
MVPLSIFPKCILSHMHNACFIISYIKNDTCVCVVQSNSVFHARFIPHSSHISWINHLKISVTNLEASHVIFSVLLLLLLSCSKYLPQHFALERMKLLISLSRTVSTENVIYSSKGKTWHVESYLEHDNTEMHFHMACYTAESGSTELKMIFFHSRNRTSSF